jgi:hypothetical protein
MKDRQPSLFPPPEPPSMAGSAVLDFNLVLKDGSPVSVRYERHYLKYSAHLEFRGDSISSTGYYSFFPSGEGLMNEPDDKVVEAARVVAERLREKRLEEIDRETRRGKRGSKSKVKKDGE